MNVIAFAIEASKLAIMAIILWYVCEVLAMPVVPKRVCQMLIVLIAILATISMVLAGSPPRRDRSMSMDRVPNIMVPEK
jgi:hypothetical protein